FPEPGPALRAGLWRALLPPGVPVADDALHQLAARFRFGPGRIARAVRRAEAESLFLPPGARALTPAALEHACRAVGSAAMGPLAQKLPLPFARADLIVPAPLAAELDLAVAWVRYHHRVLVDWGFAGRVTLGRG